MPPHGDDNLLHHQLADAVNHGTPLPWAALAVATEQLLERLAHRDLAGLPLYVELISTTELSSDVVVAWCSKLLAYSLKAQLGARWRGAGIAIIVNDRLLAAEVEPESQAASFVAAAVHEFAHAVEKKWADDIRSDEPPSSDAVAFAHLVTRHQLGCQGIQLAEQARVVYDAGHDPAGHLRVLLHLLDRARSAGVTIPVMLAQPQLHCWSRADLYQRLLGDEPARLPDRTFVEILSRPLPDEYAQRCRYDSSRFTPTEVPPCSSGLPTSSAAAT